ncbi:hypothetical protein [Listeria cornellensis]|uniref:Uncharacterized protein n=1 Tax=Listeria cornellensis FSL F6-0969 TaxID=1265820 RepID=W7BJW4_9LIST|nr:hypothetical protein [Listeria cornellensis]EUJ27359.1 hypothetical protein PCORN_13557 [Listeria cornellensis FSL F6-0969]
MTEKFNFKTRIGVSGIATKVEENDEYHVKWIERPGFNLLKTEAVFTIPKVSQLLESGEWFIKEVEDEKMNRLEGLQRQTMELHSAYAMKRFEEKTIKELSDKIKNAASFGKSNVFIHSELVANVIKLDLMSDLNNEGFEIMHHADSLEVSWTKKINSCVNTSQ